MNGSNNFLNEFCMFGVLISMVPFDYKHFPSLNHCAIHSKWMEPSLIPPLNSTSSTISSKIYNVIMLFNIHIQSDDEVMLGCLLFWDSSYPLDKFVSMTILEVITDVTERKRKNNNNNHDIHGKYVSMLFNRICE